MPPAELAVQALGIESRAAGLENADATSALATAVAHPDVEQHLAAQYRIRTPLVHGQTLVLGAIPGLCNTTALACKHQSDQQTKAREAIECAAAGLAGLTSKGIRPAR